MKSALIIILLSLPTMTLAAPSPGTAALLLSQCESYLDKTAFEKAVNKNDKASMVTIMFNGGSCQGQMNGVRDTMYFYEFLLAAQPESAQLTCIPQTAGTDQIAKIFVKYANENPAKLHERASGIIMKSLGKAFPCK